MNLEYDWQTCMGKLVQRGSFLLKTAWRNDVSFNVGQESNLEIFKAHKLILAMASPVFEAMLFGGMAEETTQPIRIPDIHPEAFKALLQYIYTDEVVLNAVDKVVELCYAGKKYMLPQLVRQCTQFIWKDLSPNNACRAYEFAKLFDVPSLKDKCVQVFKMYTEEVLQSSDFPDISSDTLSVILSQPQMSIHSEKVVFDAVVSWAKQESLRQGVKPTAANMRQLLGENLYAVRFFAMTPAEFTTGPALSEFFNDEEILAILMNISRPGIKPLPETLKGVQINPNKRVQCHTRYYCALSYPSCSDSCIRLAQSPFITELRIFVDKDIFFHGIVVNSQVESASRNVAQQQKDISSLNSSDSNRSVSRLADHHDDTQPSTYQENILLQLCSADCEPLAETRFARSVRWDDKIEVTMESPYLIRWHTGYVLRVTFGSMGFYRRYTELMGPSETDGIHITCSYMNGFLTAVHTIIFSRADYLHDISPQSASAQNSTIRPLQQSL